MSEAAQTTGAIDPGLVEAILFAAGEPIRPADVAAAFGIEPQAVTEAIEEIGQLYAARGSGLQIRRVGEGYRIYTRPEHAEAVGHFANRSRVGRLSRAALETLAVIAYRQPITRGEISRVRGVNADSALGTLQDRGLVSEVGRDPGPGRPPVYGTTPLFLEKIGLASVSELPPLASFAPDEHVAAEIEQALAPRPLELLDTDPDGPGDKTDT